MRTANGLIFSVIIAAAVAPGCQWVAPERAAVEHYVRGQLLAEQGDLDAALAELAEAVRCDPTLSVAHSAAGDIYRRRGNYKSAQRSYESACKANPYAFRPHYNLGVTYQILSEAAKTLDRIEQYLRQAVNTYLRAIMIAPNDFDANLNLCACYFQLGKYDLALQYCQAAIRINPNKPEAYNNLAIIYDSQNRLYDAIRAYKASLELDTHQPQLLLNFGSTYMRQGRIKSALHLFKLAAEEAPNDPHPWEQIGICYYHLRDYDQAVTAYEQAIELDAGSAAAHRGLGVVYMTRFVMDRSKVQLRDKALEEWNLSLETDPDQEDIRKLVQKYTPRLTGPEL
ncbi:MAG: tetratricopeptide repeat protein [Planctomycetota bacterium]|nr:tetratricopeptide repeat protein [Planctomycetota bacterium]